MKFSELITNQIKDEKLRARFNELCNMDISEIYPELPSFTINDLMEKELMRFAEKSIELFLKENPQ